MFGKKSKKKEAEIDTTEVIEEDVFEDMVEDEEYLKGESEDLEESEDEELEDEEGLEDFDESEILSQTEEEVKVKKPKKAWKIVLIVFGIIVAILLAAYLGGVAFFSQYFYYGTMIDGQDYSLKQIEDVEAYQQSVVAAYDLTLTASDGSEEVITSSDIGLSYVTKTEISNILDEQDALRWPEMFFYVYEYTTTIEVEYDDTAFNATIDALACMDEESMVESVSAYPEYVDGEYTIVPYVLGTVIEESVFTSMVDRCVTELTATANIEEEGCYALPEETEDSTEVIDLTTSLNTMLQGTITYSEGEVIDAETLSSWIIIGEDNELSFDNDLIKAFVSDLADKYNTVGTTRSFTSGSGSSVEVSGGSYGWTVDESDEIAQIKADIQAGEAVEREIEYSSRGASHGSVDWGTTYAEIDLTNQKVYFIENGEVVVSGSVVTGDVDGGNATPQGVYSLSYKTTDAVLRGTQYADGTYEYESPVSYWMPFNGGIGMHDASWRSSFGGTIYKTSGSHGCINMSYSTAQSIYSYISSGDPVICHY